MVSPVIVNVHTEMGQLPEEILKAQQGVAGPYPYVILADPALTKVYGAYNHTKLKGQDYRDIFRDAKRAASADIREDKFNLDLGPSKAEEKVARADDEEASPDAAVQEEEIDMVRIENPKMRTWTSSKGTTLEAKLVGVEDNKIFVLMTGSGDKIRVTEKQLSLKSRIAAKELAGIY